MPTTPDLPPPARGGLVTIAVNPAASRSSHALTEAVRRAAASAGHEVNLVVAQAAGEIGSVAREASARGDAAFLVVGGDGSVAEAAAALAGSTVPMLIVPAGTGNLLATGLGQSRDARVIARILRERTCRVIDLGQVEAAGSSRIFTVAAGAGFDAAVMAATPRRFKRRLGQAGYLLTAIGRSASIKQADFRIETPEGRLEARAAVILVANCLDRVLGTLKPRVPIDASDGLLDVFVVPGSNGLSLVASTARLLNAPRASASTRGSIRLRTSEIRIEASPAQPIELDGDPFPPTSAFTIRAVPSALRVLTPLPTPR